MDWNQNHSESERLASQAEAAAREGNRKRAATLYCEAAEAECLALAVIDRAKIRTVGITAVSAVSLFYKAGEHAAALDLGRKYLDAGSLPEFAQHQIREILDAILCERVDEKGQTAQVYKTGCRKPPTVIDSEWFRVKSSLHLACMLIAKKARESRPMPDSVWQQVSNLPGLRIDRNSFRRDGHDVLFHAWLGFSHGKEKSVWVRAGSLESQRAAVTLEQNLLRGITEIAKGVWVELMPAEKEQPTHAKPRSIEIFRKGRQLALCASRRDYVEQMARISN